ncbi:MAG: hypothetical protein SGPRY_007693, partial [Prymnesium sp.]
MAFPCAELAESKARLSVLPERYGGRLGGSFAVCIDHLTRHDPHALALYRQMARLALLSLRSSAHPSGIANWLRLSEGEVNEGGVRSALSAATKHRVPLSPETVERWVGTTRSPSALEAVLRAAVMREVVAARPSEKLLAQLTTLGDEIVLAAAVSPSRCLHNERSLPPEENEGIPGYLPGDDLQIQQSLPSRGVSTEAVDPRGAADLQLPAHDGVVGLQVRSWRDALEMGETYRYDPAEQYQHFWKCARTVTTRLLARLSRQLGRPARVLVWLTSDVLPEVSALFYKEMTMEGVVLATPSCSPTPRYVGIADHSLGKKGDGPVRAIAH